jgi:hypothetical protein
VLQNSRVKFYEQGRRTKAAIREGVILNGSSGVIFEVTPIDPEVPASARDVRLKDATLPRKVVQLVKHLLAIVGMESYVGPCGTTVQGRALLTCHAALCPWPIPDTTVSSHERHPHEYRPSC